MIASPESNDCLHEVVVSDEVASVGAKIAHLFGKAYLRLQVRQVSLALSPDDEAPCDRAVNAERTE